jgi:hypothetical protein
MPPVETPHPVESPRAVASGRAKIFISYRRRDFAAAPVAELLYKALKSRFGGKQVFMDMGSLEGGDLFREDIAAALASCRALLAVIGPQWLNAADEQGRRRLDDPDDMVRSEISTALKRGVLVIPVLVQDASLPREDELPDDLKPLSQHEAKVIRRGKLDDSIGELVGLLKRKLRRRRIRRAVAVAEAVLLAATIIVLYFLLSAAVPVVLSPKEGNIVLPKVSHQLKQEMVVEGLTQVGTGGLLLRYDGEAVADVRVDIESGRASDRTLNDLEPSNLRWGQDWTYVAYTTEGRKRVSSPAPAPAYDRACSMLVEVRAAHDTELPTWIRFFQRSTPSSPSAYREVELRADKELAVTFKTVPPKGADADGPGCSKRLKFGADPSAAAPQDSVIEVYAAPSSALIFHFTQRDKDMTSGRKDFMRFGEHPNDTIEPFTLMVTPLHARAIKVRSYDDRNNADAQLNTNDQSNADEKVSFSASSVDDFLLLRSLSVGPDYLRFALEGRAYVKMGNENLPSGLGERVRLNFVSVALLLTVALGLAISLVYTLIKL